MSAKRSDTFDTAELTAAPMEALQRQMEGRTDRLERSGELVIC